MSTVGGPNIVKDGLVLDLDAANNFRSFASDTLNVEYLIVAGGGGGGSDNGGGGGGGGVLASGRNNVPNAILTPQNYTITVGNGGRNSGVSNQNLQDNGENSSAFGFTAIGGGQGSNGQSGSRATGNGGSGGGGQGEIRQANDGGGTGVTGQGFDGGDGGTRVANTSGDFAGGGGGGATEPGGNANASTGAGSIAGDGGQGYLTNIDGNFRYYGSGGAGGRGNNFGGGGAGTFNGKGLDGGGSGNTGGTGQVNSGGGGGGSSATGAVGGAGGSGIVIVRYRGPQKAGGGTITQFNGWTIHTFTSSGTFTVGSFIGDMSGNENHGELINGVGFNSDNLGSLVFDGVDDRISTNFTDVIDDVTIECWYRGTKTTRNHLWGFGIGPTTNLFCNFNDTGIPLWFYWNGNGTPRLWFTQGNFTDGTIKQLVFTHTGSDNQAYLNGQLLTSGRATAGTQTFNNVNGSGSFNIGVAGGPAFSGDVYQVRIYNRALTPEEIQQNYNATKGRYGL